MQLLQGERMKKVFVVLAVICLSTLSFATGLQSAARTVTMTATVPESLSMSLDVNAVSFTLAPNSASNPGSVPVNVSTNWVLSSGRTNVKLYAFFSSATAALTDGGNNIPSSAFKISDNGGASAAVTQTLPGYGVAGSALQLATVAITGANRIGSRTDALTFNIDTTAFSLTQATVYTGTLSIQAEATP
jgi:hypothetical protein